MDDIERAQRREEMDRDLALRAARNQPTRDYAGEICTGCDYATRTTFGKNCEAWTECLNDLQRRERGQAFTGKSAVHAVTGQEFGE